jgi:hypothetical protein
MLQGVEPMYSVLEDSALYLREDVPEMPKNRYEFILRTVYVDLLYVCFCTVLAIDKGLCSEAT